MNDELLVGKIMAAVRALNELLAEACASGIEVNPRLFDATMRKDAVHHWYLIANDFRKVIRLPMDVDVDAFFKLCDAEDTVRVKKPAP